MGGRRAAVPQVDHNAAVRRSIPPCAVRLHPLIGVQLQKAAHIIDVVRVLFRRQRPPVDGQKGLRRQHQEQCKNRRLRSHVPQAPDGAIVLDAVNGLRFPAQGLPPLAGTIALIIAVELVDGDPAAHALTKDAPSPSKGRPEAQLPSVPVPHLQAKQSFARGGPQGAEQQRLHPQHQCIADIALQQANEHIGVRVPAQHQQLHRRPQQAVHAQVQ